MKILNKTHWRTDHLRAFATRVAQDELDPAKRRRIRITFDYTRGRGNSYSSGHATIGGYYCTVRLPHQDRATPSRVDLAYVLAHEFAHLRGVNRREMRGAVRYSRIAGNREFYAWAQELPLERNPQTVPLPATPETKAAKLQARREKRWASAERLATQWARRAVLAQRKAKRWAQRARAFRKALDRVAAATPPPAITGEGA
jgi:hypothetical protein